jgi:hypothetical protein
MDKKMEDQVKKKLKDGWIKSWMMIEVLAVDKETTKKSLEEHVKKMEREKKTIIFKKDFKEIQKLENPLPNIEEAYSNVVELELLTENFEKLVYLAMNYAPSSIEILEPEKIHIDMGEAQGIVVSVADMLHKFARAGVGGVVINS